MTDKLKEALADLNRTMRDIREGNTRFPTGRQDGDFFSFPRRAANRWHRILGHQRRARKRQTSKPLTR